MAAGRGGTPDGQLARDFPFLAPVVSFVDLLVGTDAKLVYWIL